MIALLTKLKVYIIGIIVAFGALIYIYFAGKKIGKSENEVDSANKRISDNEALAVNEINNNRAASERELNAVKAAKDETDKVISTDINSVADELRRDWSRSDSKSDDNSASGSN